MEGDRKLQAKVHHILDQARCPNVPGHHSKETMKPRLLTVMTSWQIEEYVVEELEERHAPQPPSSFPQQPGGKVVLVPVGSKA